MAWDDLASDLADSVIDAFGVSITYRKRFEPAFTAATGITTSSSSDTSINASRSRGRTQMFGDGKTRADVVIYTIAYSDLGFEPDMNDEIVDGGTTRYIFSVETSVDKKMREIYTQLRRI